MAGLSSSCIASSSRCGCSPVRLPVTRCCNQNPPRKPLSCGQCSRLTTSPLRSQINCSCCHKGVAKGGPLFVAGAPVRHPTTGPAPRKQTLVHCLHHIRAHAIATRRSFATAPFFVRGICRQATAHQAQPPDEVVHTRTALVHLPARLPPVHSIKEKFVFPSGHLSAQTLVKYSGFCTPADNGNVLQHHLPGTGHFGLSPALLQKGVSNKRKPQPVKMPSSVETTDRIPCPGEHADSRHKQ